jgi:Putative adhesin
MLPAPAIHCFRRKQGTSDCASSYIPDRKGAGRRIGAFHEMQLTRSKKFAFGAALALALAAAGLAGCSEGGGVAGTADRKLTVDGPVRLEIVNGGGDTHVTAGPPGEVRIHVEFHVRAWPWQNAQRRLNVLTQNPPVTQQGNLIRVGGYGATTGHSTVDFSIIAPAETQVRATTGSGNIDVIGIEGPANFSTGSGAVSATNVSGDIQASTGSGSIQLASIHGQVQASAGSGDISAAGVRGDVRASTGSGAIRIAGPVDAVVVGTGSGSVTIASAASDLRVRTGSGNITVNGDPEPTTYWDFRAGSGNVILQVSPAASFRLYARSKSGDIDAAIPIVMEGTTGKHELRARIGDGKARVEVETSSGGIALR